MKKLLFLVSCFLVICGFDVLADDTVSYRQPAAGQESDPIVGAINGIVKADGAGNVSQAMAGTDYLSPNGSAANLTDFPTLNQNTTGTAAGLSGTPALPDGTTATTQSSGDNSTKISTTAYSDAKVADSINDGTTTVAPSENAVYDALAGKVEEGTYSNYADTSTITGWSSLTTKNIYVAKIGKRVFIDFTLIGSSNSTTTKFSLPFARALLDVAFLHRCQDNTGSWAVSLGVVSSANEAYFYKDIQGASWTASGDKAVMGQFSYTTSD